MKSKLLLITLLALILIALAPVQAMDIIMGNPDDLAQRDIVVFWPNGTMYGYFNDSSIISLDDNSSSYMMTIKHLKSNALDDPQSALQDGFNWITTWWIQIVFVFTLVGIVFFWRR